MNKKFSEFFAGYGMKIDGNFAVGEIKGYETNVRINAGVYAWPLIMHISFYATDEQRRNIELGIKNLALKFFMMNFTKYGLTISLNGMTLSSLLKRLPDVLNKIYGVISSNGALTKEYCPVCGRAFEDGNYSERNIEGFKIRIDNDCVNTINAVIKAENQDFEDAPNNYLLGFLGALIGGVVGSIVAFILYYFGFISSISALVSIALGTFLYRKFHGKQNAVMIVIVASTTAVCMLASVFVVYVIAAMGIVLTENPDAVITLFGPFIELMGDPEFSRLFVADLLMVLLFTAIGIVGQVVYMAKQLKRIKNI